MLNKTMFTKICEQMQMTAREREFAALVWTAAESASYGQSTQLAALLKQETQPVSLGTDLSKSDLQFMKVIFSGALQFISMVQHDLKNKSQELWQNSDKNNSETKPAFIELNKVRTAQRKLKVKAKKISNLQHKIKKILSE